MKHFRLLVVVFCLLLISASLGIAQDKVASSTGSSQAPGLSVSKGTVVVPKFSRGVISPQFNAPIGSKITVKIERGTDGKLTLNGSDGWKGLPLMTEFKFEKYEVKDDLAELTLSNASTRLTMRVGTTVGDVNKAFQEIFFVGSFAAFERSGYFREQVVNVMFPKIFRGSLSGLPLGTKLELARAAVYDIDAIGTVEYKNEEYFVFRIVPDVALNSALLDERERASYTLDQSVLPLIRALYKKIGPLAGLKGIKIAASIRHRNAIDEVWPRFDELEIYSPISQIAKFDAAQITKQDLVDKSILQVNGFKVRALMSRYPKN